MIVRISWIIISVDKSLQLNNKDYSKILLTEDGDIPSVEFKSFKNKTEEKFLRQLCEKHLNYKYEFVLKRLSDVVVRDNRVDIIYTSSVPYSFSFVKSGKLVSLVDNLEIDERYQRAITGSGTAFF